MWMSYKGFWKRGVGWRLIGLMGRVSFIFNSICVFIISWLYTWGKSGEVANNLMPTGRCLGEAGIAPQAYTKTPLVVRVDFAGVATDLNRSEQLVKNGGYTKKRNKKKKMVYRPCAVRF